MCLSTARQTLMLVSISSFDWQQRVIGLLWLQIAAMTSVHQHQLQQIHSDQSTSASAVAQLQGKVSMQEVHCQAAT